MRTPSFQRVLKFGITILGCLIVVLLVAWAYLTQDTKSKNAEVATLSPSQQQTNQQDTTQSTNEAPTTSTQNQEQPKQEEQNQTLVTPITKFSKRITKKTFGMYIEPKTSPVQPEKFKGYHTGADAEITSAELDAEVSVYAIADGIIKSVDQVSGYGGVVVIGFTYNNNQYTALYGHLKKASVAFRPGDTIKKGQRIGILGRDKSQETDGERKHLHISIHLGPDVVFAGYVNTKSELTAWTDPVKFLAQATDIATFK